MKLFTGLLAFSFLTAPLLAQEAVDQKTYILAKEGNPLPQKGVFKAVRHMTMSDGEFQVEFGEQKMDGKMNTSAKEELVYTFVSEDQVRVVFEKNRGSEKTVMMGQEKDEEKIDPSEGKTILLEKKDGKWVGKLEAGEINEGDQEGFDKALKSLEKEFNDGGDAKMYGTEPRKVGETWDVDPSLMPGMEDFGVKGGKLTMTFLEVKEFQGETCAVLKTSFSIKAEMLDEKMKGMGATLEGNGRIVRSLTYMTDYKFVGEMTMDMSGDMEVQPGMNAKMSMKGKMKIDMRMAKASAKAE